MILQSIPHTSNKGLKVHVVLVQTFFTKDAIVMLIYRIANHPVTRTSNVKAMFEKDPISAKSRQCQIVLVTITVRKQA